ncbi:MAG TPA: hypothetical protein VEQ65_13560, partial [Opitutus sp.]|nr:hypothetical protein [Opitutus sp.]
LYPQTREMGTGDVPGSANTYGPANATWIFDAFFGTARPATRAAYVAYPPAGYVPYQLVWPRWSFSYPGADFSTASITMARGGQSVPVAIESRANGAGEPTLVWAYNGLDPNSSVEHPKPSADTTYTVTVSNVRIAGAPQTFSYNVVVFDPAVPSNDAVTVAVTGPATASTGVGTSYTITKPSFTSSFDWRTLQLTAFTKSYGAENGLDSITASISPGYNATQSGVVGAGASSFHLAHAAFADQALTLPETFVVTQNNAAIGFLSRLGFATTAQTARVQVSADGRVWTDVYTQAGTGNSGEAGFSARSASLASFVGRTIRVRFNYTVALGGSAFTQTDNGVGWSVDNITLSGVQSAAASAATNAPGTTFTYTPGATGTFALQARGVLFGAYPLEWGPVAQVTVAAAGPTFTTQPLNQTGQPGATLNLTAAAAGATFQWQLNGTTVSGANAATLTLSDLQPEKTGLYTALATSSSGTTTSTPAIVGVATSSKVIGAGAEVSPNVRHPNGNTFDQILLSGAAATITAEHMVNQITRMSYIDVDHDIVQVEFSGPGTLSLVLDNPAVTPAPPLRYNQPSVSYAKGHASIVITGATEQTNVSVFTVGRATAFDPSGTYNILVAPSTTNNPANNGSPLFQGHAATAYDGIADLAFIAIASANGKFGGLRTSNANYFAAKGLTGVYAPGVAFQGPVFIGDITAFDAAKPVLVLGSAADARITGGDLLQTNGQPVQVSGLSQLKFTAGGDSHGNPLAAQANQAVLQQDGVNVTSQIVVNP